MSALAVSTCCRTDVVRLGVIPTSFKYTTPGTSSYISLLEHPYCQLDVGILPTNDEPILSIIPHQRRFEVFDLVAVDFSRDLPNRAANSSLRRAKSMTSSPETVCRPACLATIVSNDPAIKPWLNMTDWAKARRSWLTFSKPMVSSLIGFEAETSRPTDL